MAMRKCDVAVIGAGTAGLKAYKAARARGADVLLLERGHGGTTCTRTGCMPSKLLLAAANAVAGARRADIFGIRINGTTVDAAAVLARVRRERDRFVAAVLREYHAIPDEHRLHGTARFVAPDRLTVGDMQIEARAIVVATGAAPVIPDSLEAVRHLVRTHETIFEIETIPSRIAVLGAGAVGIELAQAFARLGATVVVIDEGDMIGGLTDPVANDRAVALLSREIDLQLGNKARAEAAGDAARICWSGRSSGETTVDCIIAAAGRPPSLDPLDLDASGLERDAHGTPVFDHRTRRCASSSIFIAGDAGAWRPVLHEAARSGWIAGHVAAGGEAPRILPALAITFTEPNLVEAGMTFDALPDDARIATIEMADNGRATVEGDEDPAGDRPGGVVRLYADADGLLLGASIVAVGGEHLGQMCALALDRGMTADEFADQPWYHPTIAETLQQAARELAGIED